MTAKRGAPPAALARLVRVGAALGVLTAATACGLGSNPLPQPPSPSAGNSGSTAPAAGESCAYPQSGEPAKPVDPPDTAGVATSGSPRYVISTNAGNVTVTLDPDRAPCTVNSFRSLADQGYFDQTRCHRLADSGIFVLQCGDPTGTGRGGPGYSFGSETDGTESYTRGAVAMANAGPDSNGSQFFLVWADSTQLDSSPNYTIFGRMDTDSVNVVAMIAAEGQDGSNSDGTGRPNNPAEIVRVRAR